MSNFAYALILCGCNSILVFMCLEVTSKFLYASGLLFSVSLQKFHHSQGVLLLLLLLQGSLKSCVFFPFSFSYQNGNLRYGSAAALHVGYLQANKECLFTF